MTSYERTITSLKRQQPDRVPIFCYIDETSQAASQRLRDFVTSHADVLYSRILYTGFQCTGLQPSKKITNLDDNWIECTYHLPDGIEFSEIYKHGESGDYIGYRKHVIDGPDDIKQILQLPYLPPPDNPELACWLEEINAFGAVHCTDGAFFRIAFLGPFGCLAGSVSPEDFAMLMIENENIVREYMDVALERQMEYLEHVMQLLQVPVIINIGGAEYAIPPLMSPKAFHEYIVPYDGKLTEVAHKYDRLVYYHSHGKVRDFIPSFIEMGVDGLHPIEPVGPTGDCDLAEVKSNFGRDICLVGNIQYDDLARLSRDQIQALVRDTVLTAKEGGAFILSPSCSPYHNPISSKLEENIIAYIETGLLYGQY